VTSSGTVAGDEVVQLYVRDDVASLTRPVKELRGFRRLSLKPGDTGTVRFMLGNHAPGDGRTTFAAVPGSEFRIEADLVLLAMGFTGPRRDGVLAQFGVDLTASGWCAPTSPIAPASPACSSMRT